MARRLVTNEDVFAVADALAAEGKKVTTGTIYAELKRGSNSTIQKGLALWEANHKSETSVQKEELSAEVSENLKAQGLKMAFEMHRLAKAEANAAVALSLEALNARHVRLEEDLEAASKIEADREAYITGIEEELDQVKALHEADGKKLAEAVATISHLRADAEKTAEKIEKMEFAAHNSATDAQHQAALIATVTTQLAAAEDREKAAQARIQELNAALATAQETIARGHAEAKEQSNRIATVEAAFSGSEAREKAALENLQNLTTALTTAQKDTAKAQAEAREQGVKIAELSERVGSLGAKLEAARTEGQKALKDLEDAHTASNEAQARVRALEQQEMANEKRIQDLEARVAQMAKKMS